MCIFIIFPWNIQIDGRRRRRRTGNGPAAARSWRPGLLRRARKFLFLFFSLFFFFCWGRNGSLSSPLIPYPLWQQYSIVYMIHPSIRQLLGSPIFAPPPPFLYLCVRKRLGARRRAKGLSPFVRNRFASRPMIHYDVKEHVNFSSDSSIQPDVLSKSFLLSGSFFFIF